MSNEHQLVEDGMCVICNSTDPAVKNLAEIVEGEVLWCWSRWHNKENYERREATSAATTVPVGRD